MCKITIYKCTRIENTSTIVRIPGRTIVWCFKDTGYILPGCMGMSDNKQILIIAVVAAIVIICIAGGAYVVLSNHGATVIPEPASSAVPSNSPSPSSPESDSSSPTAVVPTPDKSSGTSPAASVSTPTLSPGPSTTASPSSNVKPSGGIMPVINANKLSTPKLSSPPNGTVYTINNGPRKVVFMWSAVDGATGYLIEEEFDGRIGYPPADWESWKNVTVIAPTYTDDYFIGCQPGRWRVRALDSTGKMQGSDPSEWSIFVFKAAPTPTPTIGKIGTVTAKPIGTAPKFVQK